MSEQWKLGDTAWVGPLPNPEKVKIVEINPLQCESENGVFLGTFKPHELHRTAQFCWDAKINELREATDEAFRNEYAHRKAYAAWKAQQEKGQHE